MNVMVEGGGNEPKKKWQEHTAGGLQLLIFFPEKPIRCRDPLT
jgi:hypothetical protein